MAQIRTFNFMCAVMKRAQFGDAPSIDIETGNRNPGARKCGCNRQSDIAKPDNRNFTPVCHEFPSPSPSGYAPSRIPQSGCLL